MPDARIPELDTGFTFERRPVSIPGDLRPGWRIAAIVLLINKCCRQNRTTFARLHVLSWAVRTESSRRSLLAAIDGLLTPDAVIARVEPSLNRAVDFALGEGLLRRVDGDRIELTQAGLTLADEVNNDDVAFSAEKQFIGVLRKRLTENMVNQLFRRGQ